MRVIPIIEQLKAAVPLLGGRVEQTRSLVALPDKEIGNDLPIVFVHTHDEGAGNNESIGGVSQNIPKRFSIMMASKNIDLDAGSEPLEDLRAEIMTAMLGFQIDDEHAPITYEGGKILDVSRRLIWWVDTFSTWAIIESA